MTAAIGLVAGACSDDDDPDTGDDESTEESAPPVEPFTLSSTSFDDGGTIPAVHTCDGENTQPAFAIGGAPEGTSEVVLIVDDPDAPDGTFIHWTVWGLDPAGDIDEGAPPAGAIEGTTGVGSPGWFGPCPPPGDPHNYEFQLTAVSEPVDLPAGATVDELRAAIADTTIEETVTVGIYQRS